MITHKELIQSPVRINILDHMNMTFYLQYVYKNVAVC